MIKNFYTSREQSRRLMGLLPEDTADLVYNRARDIPVVRREIHSLPYDELPCWSTGALLDMLPSRKDKSPLILKSGGYTSSGYTRNWFLWVECNENISDDNDYDLVELLVRTIERIYKNDKKEE